MKKRVLSFLLACFMVVSTFIISKPLVEVHAVEENNDGYLDMTPVFDGTSLFDTTGNVELVGYHRDTGIYRDGIAMSLEGSEWYVRDYRFSSTSHQRLWRGVANGKINYAGGHHWTENSTIGDGIGSALIFTAPRQGKYEFNYSHTIDWAGTFGCGVELRLEDANGNVIKSVSGKTNSATLVLNATVYLDEDEAVYIIRCPMKKGENGITTENRSTNGIASVSIAQLDYYPDVQGERLDMTPVFDGTSRFDTLGNVELAGYHRDADGSISDKVYTEGLDVTTTTTHVKVDGNYVKAWVVRDTSLPLTSSGSVGHLWRGTMDTAATAPINYAGGHHWTSETNSKGDGIGSALVFTAPRGGKYEFSYSQHSSWTNQSSWGTSGFEIFIADEDGIKIDSQSIMKQSTTITVTATVHLKRGEKIYIVNVPMKIGENGVTYENRSSNGAASISIAQLDYVSCDNGCVIDKLVAIEKVEPDSYLVPGYAAHYECTNCGKLWADADATIPTTLEELEIVIPSFTEPEKVGQTFYAYKRLKAEKPLPERPNTFEAWIKVPTDATDKRIGAIYSNHVDAYAQAINFEIEAGGHPQLRWQIQWNQADQITFDEIDVRTGEWLHLVIVRDIENQVGYCYVNGELKQTASFLYCNGYIETSSNTMCVGGGNTGGNSAMFKQSRIHSVAAYSDMRTATEIASDYANGITDVENLLAYYIISPEGNDRLRDYSPNKNHLTVTNQAMSSVEEKYIPELTSENYGTKFGWNDNYIFGKTLTNLPRKINATVYFPDQFLDNVRGGVIVSDYLGKVPTFSFEIYSNGYPRLYIQNNAGASHDITFATVNVYNGKKTNLEVIIEADAVKLFVDGVLAETKSVNGIGAFVDAIKPARNMIVGGDYRERNDLYFKGQLIDLEIDGVGKYNFTAAGETVTDLSGNGNDLKKSGYLLDYEAPEDFAYSLLVLGDTQYMNDRYPENFVKIYDWILENKDTHKIQYVMGVGDITDTDDASEWNRAKKQFDRLNGKVPYSLVIGNHDGSEKMNATFNTDTYNATLDGKYGDGIENSYRLITVGKVKYLIMTLEFGYRDDVIDWANEVIAAHPTYNVIITTHGYLSSNGAGLLANGADSQPSSYDATLNDADVLWDNLVSKHANISFVICGHVGASTVHTLDAVGDNGNVVKQILVNPQGFDARHPGGFGMVTLLYFNEDGSEMQIRTYSTVYDGEHHDEVSYDPNVSVVACTHTGFWKDGVCSECGKACEHNYNVTLGKAECIICGYKPSGIFVKHVSNLLRDNTVDGQFFIGALEFATNKVWAVEPAPRMTWGGVDTWAGNWIDGYNAYVTQTSEWNNADDTTDTRIRFDMYYTGDEKFGGLVGFTAPADGVFGINALFRKVWGGNPDIVVMKSDGTVIETFAAGGYGKETAIAIDGIELNKGEQILLVMQKGANTSGKNVGFISFDVDAIYDECPHTYGDDSTCDYCGEACKHSYGDDSICDDCGEACTHSYGNDNVCDNCGHDRTIEVETEDVENAINNILNGGTADITVVGPTTTMNEAFVVEKIENTVGYQYVLFNIDFDANGKLFLRHHFIVTGELPEVTVDSVAETLKQDE
ncbi:MAG: metallophosphoesterase, partial [Clostridia bacterium]|nr:metallophosphoesterase [Clostridia bacterium]